MTRSHAAICTAGLLLIMLSQILPADARTAQLSRYRPMKPQPHPEPPSAISAYLDKVAAQLWLHSRSEVEFCFGNSQQRAEELLRESFALTLPDGDGICSDAEQLETKLCSPDDMMFYYKVRCSVSPLL